MFSNKICSGKSYIQIIADRNWNSGFTNLRKKNQLYSYMWTFRREHFSPDFEGPLRPSRQLSKSSAREKNQVQKKSWPTFCDQYFWKFPIWNSYADKKRREIRMVKVNVIFNDIRLLICLTPLQVNWVMVIN